MGEQAGLS